MSVLFFIRRNRGNDDVEAPIYMRVTIAGERYELGTKRLYFQKTGLQIAVALWGIVRLQGQ